MSGKPAIPVHPHVYEIAVEQLRQGISISQVRNSNLKTAERKAYRGQEDEDESKRNWRYVLDVKDHCTLYRKLAMTYGINIRRAPQYNLENWIKGPVDRLPENVQNLIRDAIFHYSPIIERGELLKVCISTPEMDEAAQKYVHKGQLIFDGTFGVASSRILLFIAMGVDEHGKGLPVAFFLFSAPEEAKVTHANYDTTILTEFFRIWQRYLAGKFGDFDPAVAITDNDIRERLALLTIWPNIILLLCKYHARERWKNSRRQRIKGREGCPSKLKVNQDLSALEHRLLDTVDYHIAFGYLQSERACYENQKKQGGGSQAVDGAIKHIDYFINNWMDVSLWKSWSLYGRTAAAAVLKIPVDRVLTTTNHLEHFNGILKRKEIAAWLHSGYRMRFDTLIFVLITKILPNIYRKHRARQKYSEWLTMRFRDAAGGADVVELGKSRQAEKARKDLCLCWWVADERRDTGALEILCAGLLGDRMDIDRDRNTFRGQCRSSKGNAIYSLEICHNGHGLCTCPDFQSRGGACKHLRALRIPIDRWLQQHYCQPFHYPSSVDEALAIQNEPVPRPPDSVSELVTGPDLMNLQFIANDMTTIGDDHDLDEADDMEPDEDAEGEDSDNDDDDDDKIVPTVTNQEQMEAIHFQSTTVLASELNSLVPRLARIDQAISLMKSIALHATPPSESVPPSPTASHNSPQAPSQHAHSLLTTPSRPTNSRSMRRTVSQPNVFQDVEQTPVPQRTSRLSITNLTNNEPSEAPSGPSQLLPPFEPVPSTSEGTVSAIGPIRAGPFGRASRPDRQLFQPPRERKQVRKQATSTLPG
ncbi:hypothetical protein VKT23_016575 [Stygiomarasmius scandens]|uniref:SWIM-type domain-containing protein n=1 Tax=Marasmiellus scandens TaxID=2682957 RepID=A0ABR1IZ30_9AGAR